MALNKDFEDLLRLLNSAHAKYMVVGAYAVIFYTEPRYTRDIDLWVQPTEDNAEKVYKALKEFGAPVNNLTMDDLTHSNMVYQIGIEPNRIDILMGIGSLTFEKAWQNRRETTYGDEKVFMIGLEDLIIAKQDAGREKDKADLRLLQSVKKKKK